MRHVFGMVRFVYGNIRGRITVGDHINTDSTHAESEDSEEPDPPKLVKVVSK